MDAFPNLYSERLILRKIDVDDFPSLVKLANNKKISDRIINLPHPYTESNAVFRISYVVQGFKNKSRFVFSVCTKENNAFIGEVSLHLHSPVKSEIGYWIGETFWGQGFATEAVSSICKFGFSELGLHLIFGTSHRDNLASHKVLEKNHFMNKSMNESIYLFELSKEAYLKT